MGDGRGFGVRVLDVDHAEGDVVGRLATEQQRHEPLRGVATIPGGKDVRELVVGDRAVEAVAAKADPILQQFNSVRRARGSGDYLSERAEAAAAGT
jgi:hypothetical protein